MKVRQLLQRRHKVEREVLKPSHCSRVALPARLVEEEVELIITLGVAGNLRSGMIRDETRLVSERDDASEIVAPRSDLLLCSAVAGAAVLGPGRGP